MCVFITLKHMYCFSAMCFTIFYNLFIRFNNTSLCSCLYSKITKNHAVINRKIMRSVSCKFHNLIIGSIRSDISDNGKD